MRLIGLSLVWVLCGASDLMAQTQNEYVVKAAYFYNFAKFVEWPPEAFATESAPYVIGVLNDEPFTKVLEQTINEKTFNGRQFVVKRLKWGEDYRDCHLLYINTSEQRRLEQILASIKKASILTISEIDQFIHRGGILNLIMEENRILFEINADVAEQNGLKISSKLLTLARNVKRKNQRR